MRHIDHQSSAHDAALVAHARRMLHHPTPSEERLWEGLRSGRAGACFKRQVPLGGFIVDLLAPSVRLAVEIDGPYHARQRHADARRDAKLRRLGYRVLRLSAERVMRDLPGAVELVRQAVESARAELSR